MKEFFAFAKTVQGAMLLTGVLFLVGVGALKVDDLTGKNSDAKVVSDKEAMKLYIQETARATAAEVVKASDERWTERWSDLKEDVSELKRSARWSTLRSEAGASPRPSAQ